MVERDRWIYLQELEKKGTIAALKRQFIIHYHSRDEKVTLFKMIVDFCYVVGEHFDVTYEDTKGKPTNDPIWNLKRKLIEDQYGITITEVRWDKAQGTWVYKNSRRKKSDTL